MNTAVLHICCKFWLSWSPCLVSNQVALLDYGQVKELPDKLRLGYASLILAIADSDPVRAVESYR